MLSFHHSRGRILFDAFCAFAISATFMGAWMDLGTLAFLPAAAVSGLYGLVRLFDLRGRRPVAAVGFADAAAAEEIQGDLLDYVPASQPEPIVEVWPVGPAPVEESAPEPENSEPVAKKPARARRKKPVAAVPVIVEPVEDDPALVSESTAEAGSLDPDAAKPYVAEEATHTPVSPLFEPEPFVRQQRAVFGRKAGRR
jgi:hypothetical protein